MKKIVSIFIVLLGINSSIANAALLSLTDDSFVEVSIGFNFIFFGVSYDSVFVNSNGSLSFSDGDSDWSESAGEFLNGVPRIAVWDDWNPAVSGTIETETGSDWFTISFSDVPQFGNSDSNTFSFTLFTDNSFEILLSSFNSSDMLVGITSGNGDADPGETDILDTGFVFSAYETVYELFEGDFDLPLNTLLQFEALPSAVPAPKPALLVALLLLLTIIAENHRRLSQRSK